MSDQKAAPRDFGFGEDETLLRDLAHKFLDEKLPVETLRKLVAESPEPVYDQGQRTQWDEGIWKEIVELGWTGLAVAEEEGGLPSRWRESPASSKRWVATHCPLRWLPP